MQDCRIISLDPSRPECVRLQTQLDKLGHSHSIIPGVEWLKLPDTDFRKELIEFKHSPSFTYGAAGCFLAHRDTWMTVDSSVVILEDDAGIREREWVECLENLPEQFDMILLSPVDPVRKDLYRMPKGCMVRSSTSGYVISPEGAARFLEGMRALRTSLSGWECKPRVSWILPAHIEFMLEEGARIFVAGSSPVYHAGISSLTEFKLDGG